VRALLRGHAENGLVEQLAALERSLAAVKQAELAVKQAELAQKAFYGAQFILVTRFFGGEFVPRDDAQAVAWTREAAEQGHADAQYNLGTMYNRGKGVPRDNAQAAVWYRKAAEQGHADAQYNLGTMYNRGEGVPRDDAQAAVWYHKAAEQGNAAAQFFLGLFYGDGRGVPQDYAQAVAWYRKAAEQGDAAAQYNLGMMYSTGQGVVQDYVEAHMWRNLAAARATGKDQKRYADVRDSLASDMTPAQLAEAQRRAGAWVPTVSSPVAAPAAEAAVSSRVALPETAIGWRRVAPTSTAILQLKPEDRRPSPDLDMFERSAAAVAGLSGSQGTGTAVLITRDGLALTNHHVVDKQGALTATLRDGRRLAVRTLRSNPEADLALIQINCASDCFTLDLARSNPRIGGEVHVIGNPLALDYTLTRGIVSGLRLAGGVTLIQTDAALNSGNSGGPIIDAMTRDVVAIVAWKVGEQGAEGLGFGVAIQDALRVLGIQWQ
jgi:TPR repeat protein